MIFEVIGISIAIVSFFFGIWQYLQNRKIKQIISSEAIELHKNIAIALGSIQSAKDAIINGTNPSFEIGKVEGICQAILLESAKLYCNLKNTKIKDIDNMINNEQLNREYKEIYYSFSSK